MPLEQSTVEELAKLSIDLFNNPETKEKVLPLLKTVRPGMSLPELDLQEKIGRATADMTAQMQAMQDKLARAETENRIRAQRDDLISKGLATQDEIPDIEKMMIEDGISDYEKAAKYHRATKVQSIPTPMPFRQPFDHATATVGDYFKDPKNSLKRSLWEGLTKRSA